MEPLITTCHYNTGLDMSWSCCGSQFCLTMEFYKGIIGNILYNCRLITKLTNNMAISIGPNHRVTKETVL